MTNKITAQELLKTTGLQKFFEVEEVSDGYHSFQELYDHRNTLFCFVLNSFEHFIEQDLAWRSEEAVTYKVWKSEKHNDLSMYPGYFIAGFEFNGKTGTYHLEEKYWELCKVPVIAKAPKWDGHTSQDVLALLKEIINA